MKTYAVIIKQIKGGIEVTSPSGKTISIVDRQLNNASMIQNLVYKRVSKMTGINELTVSDMENLLQISKMKIAPLTGLTRVDLKKGGRYYSYELKFNDARHEDNYINKMMEKGYSFVGSEPI